jgi:putative FmdB family regulatory protein
MYEFYCEACKNSFDQMVSISARDQKVSCPACGSKKTGRKLSVVSVGGAKPEAGPSGGHVHSGMCGCGKMKGSCGMN